MSEKSPVRPARRRPTGAAELLRLIGMQSPEDPTQLQPAEDLRLVLAAPMELLNDRREMLDQYRGGLRRRYELFRCDLEESGFADRHHD